MTDGAPAGFTTGVVLAAGGSRRMGRAKLLLDLAGRCLLQWAVDAALASDLDEVVVVLGCRAEEVRAALRLPAGRARAVVCPDWERGQSASLACGLRAADPRAAAAAVLLGDQPGVGAERIDRVVAAFAASGAAAARPVYPDDGGAPGHPVVLARRIWPDLLARSGDRGARDWFAAHPDQLREVPLGGRAPADVDDAGDYERALRSLGGPAPAA